MEKRQRRILFPALPDSSAIPSHNPPARNARRRLMTERSERMSEEASFHLPVHIVVVTRVMRF
ncbi:TPA: hypothetical protein ACJCWQ_004264 [Yersinia enterocolitica]|jgi:hypothetical protein|nr:hypothetical protein [Yersinia enterocolitica]